MSDIFIFQDFQGKRFINSLKTEYLTKEIHTGLSICMPNYFFDGAHITYRDILLQIVQKAEKNKATSPKDILDFIKQDTKSIIDIINLNAQDRFKDLKHRYTKQQSLYTNRIKLYDYIEKTWQSEHTLYEVNHPTERVYVEMTRRLNKFLELKNVPKEEDIICSTGAQYHNLDFSFFKELYPNLDTSYLKKQYKTGSIDEEFIEKFLSEHAHLLGNNQSKAA